jgi:pilus assembly protein CpaE
LYNETQSRVLLMEGKLFFGHLDVMLNIRTRNSVSDLIPHASGLDDTLVHDVISEHISGIDVLLGPADIQFAQGIRTQDMYNVLTALQRMWDFIIIDAGNQLSEITVTMMDEADRILLVASPDLATLHDISRFKRISQSLAYPPEKTLLILNRADRPAGVKPKDIEAVLHQQLYALIPDDSINALRSLNRGIPLVINYPRSPASKAYKELARRLTSLGAESSATSATPTPASSPEPAPAQAQAKPAPAQAQAEPAPAQAQAEPAPVESTESVST